SCSAGTTALSRSRCPRARAPWTSRFTRGCTRSGKPLPWRPSRCFSSPWWPRWRAGARAMRERGLVVIPTYNEVSNLSPLVEQVLAQDSRLEILVVDDHSPDGTGQLAEALAQKEPRLHVLHRDAKLGLGTAYITGFKWALERGYASSFEMDADSSHDPGPLKEFLKGIAGADLVLGSRYLGARVTVV